MTAPCMFVVCIMVSFAHMNITHYVTLCNYIYNYVFNVSERLIVPINTVLYVARFQTARCIVTILLYANTYMYTKSCKK